MLLTPCNQTSIRLLSQPLQLNILGMRLTLTFLVMLSLLSIAHAQRAADDYNLVIGTYSNPEKTNGIHVYRFDLENGDATPLTKYTDINNASYLTISDDRKHLYAVSEAGQGGKVYAFGFNAATGELNMVNSASSGGDHPCYVSVDKDKRVVFVGNYSSGTLSAIPVEPDGSLKSDIQTIQHEGSGVHTTRQNKPHVHAVVLSPDGRFLFVPDLGTDRVNIYRVNSEASEPLTVSDPAFAKATEGSGPRHLVFHPNGKQAYLVQELDATVTTFEYKKGVLTSIQNVSMRSPGFSGNVGAADIHVSPDGKFVYASNRGDANDIAIYSVAKKGGLAYLGSQSTLGKTPRNFAIDPTGNFLLAANQNTNDIVIFRRDKKTGKLTDTGKRISIDKPVCLKFVKAQP